MAAFDYLTDRLDNQIAWYDRKSTTAKSRFYLLSVIQIVAATLVPVLVAFEVPGAWLAMLGASAAMATALLSLGQWQHLWIRYRATAEALKHEKYMYLVGGGPYAERPDPTELARRCEDLISSEHSVWTSLMQKVRPPLKREGGDDAPL